MNNKILIKLEYIEYGIVFEIFIPINEQIWKIIKLIEKSSADLVGQIAKKQDHILINKQTGESYDINKVLIDTDIRNGSELLLY